MDSLERLDSSMEAPGTVEQTPDSRFDPAVAAICNTF
jgi:hypothetical protein